MVDAQPPTAADVKRRRAFRVGFMLVGVGVLLHFPDYVMSAPHDFMMAGMAMGGTMATGMALIVSGLLIAGWSTMPSREQRSRLSAIGRSTHFVALDSARMTRAHWTLTVALTVGLVVDTMKPATIGFVVPAMAAEYRITTAQAAGLPFMALTGTVVGSVLWGYLADLIGRRSTILLSALIYMGTSICGFMPSLGWNMAMCFFMGASAGGMLPTVYSLMSESVPARRRGFILVVQSGLGAVLGYLVASGAAAVLEPHLSWRSLWLLGAPTGGLLLYLARSIPESPRYLLAVGRRAEAEQVMARYGITAAEREPQSQPPADAPLARPTVRRRDLFSVAYRRRTAAILLYGLGWGVVNWGFITFLPAFLAAEGYGARSSQLLFFSSLLAIPSTVLAAVLYERWSSRRSMLLYCLTTVASLLLFSVMRPDASGGQWLLVTLLVVLLASTGGMIAMLSPYSTEVFPTALRATGSGLAAAASKAGGLLGPALVLTPSIGALALIGAVPVAGAAFVLWRSGLETAGQPLVEVDPVPAA